jgi:hypothetical protein
LRRLWGGRRCLREKLLSRKRLNKFKLAIAALFVAAGYHLFVMAYGAAVLQNGQWLSWDVVADTGVYFGELAKDICSKTPDAVAALRDAGENISTAKLNY